MSECRIHSTTTHHPDGSTTSYPADIRLTCDVCGTIATTKERYFMVAEYPAFRGWLFAGNGTATGLAKHACGPKCFRVLSDRLLS